MFANQQERSPNELAAAGIDTTQDANRYLTEHYQSAFNEECAASGAELGPHLCPSSAQGSPTSCASTTSAPSVGTTA